MNTLNPNNLHRIGSTKLKQTTTVLNLRNNNIGNEGIKYLSSSLENNKTITVLNLGYNKNIGAEGIKYLSSSLEKNNTITELNLYDTNIDDNLYKIDNLIIKKF